MTENQTEERLTTARHILEIIPLVMRTLAAEMRHTGLLLTPAHFGVMVMLQERPYNLSELADFQAVSLPTMSNTVSRLADRGWVQRVRAEHDRRVVMVELTRAGRERLAEIQHEAEGRILKLLQSVTPAEEEVLNRGLVVLRDLFIDAALAARIVSPVSDD